MSGETISSEGSADGTPESSDSGVAHGRISVRSFERIAMDHERQPDTELEDIISERPIERVRLSGEYL